MTANTIHQKIIISGQDLEFFNYEIPVKRNYVRKARAKRKIKKGQQDLLSWQPKPRRKSSVNRTRTKLRRKINANASDLSRFVTLTYANDQKSIFYANKQFNLFIKRLRYLYPNLKYIAVPELTKKGNVHYHMLINYYIDNSKLREIWSHGFVKINKLRSIKNIGVYLSKYLTKEQEELFFHKKRFFYSQNLKGSIEIINYFVDKFLSTYCGQLKHIFQKKYWSEWTGSLDYIFYQWNYKKI